MKSIVIYHSITGNTKKIAQAIHAGMLQTGEPCDIARIRDVSTPDLQEYDLIGLGSPVMHGRELSNVTNFIQNTLKIRGGKQGFVFCTHGARPGYYLARVVPAMIQRGLTVIGWNDWFGSVYYPAVPKPYFTDGHPDEIDLKEAEDFGREMVERGRRISQGETGLIPSLPKGIEYDDIYDPCPPVSEAMVKEFLTAQAGIQFRLNTEKCRYPQCTFCIDNCPMGSIDLSVSPPLFNIDCDKCWLCEMACPNGAIEVDWLPFHDAHYPTVPSLQKSLEIFEARGKFRRLVPLDEIGWDTPFWKFDKPRYKIA